MILTEANDSPVNEFDYKLAQFLDGTGDYSKPPLDMICNGLENIAKYWPKYKDILEPVTKPDYVFAENDDDLLGNLSHWNYNWLRKLSLT